ncbi:MAG: integrase core domain-containing protein [Actinomycetota bacterium]|nr:integrase core domain-containing protein [Actinomycetota bacterium]
MKPELLATAPGQVWSWDITKLREPQRGVYYDLYVVLDIFSRCVVGFTVAAGEDAGIATALLAEAMAVHGTPGSVHAYRPTSMTSKPVAQLLVDLGVARSHSRPHVSNDNPFSESAFKTLNYAPAFPDRFGCLADARAFCEAFVAYYNHDHRHSGLGAAHPRLGAPRHRDRNPRPTGGHAAGGLRGHPRPLPAPAPDPAGAAHRGLDQPAQQGGPHREQLTRSCLTRLDGFRRPLPDQRP